MPTLYGYQTELDGHVCDICSQWGYATTIFPERLPPAPNPDCRRPGDCRCVIIEDEVPEGVRGNLDGTVIEDAGTGGSGAGTGGSGGGGGGFVLNCEYVYPVVEGDPDAGGVIVGFVTGNYPCGGTHGPGGGG